VASMRPRLAWKATPVEYCGRCAVCKAGLRNPQVPSHDPRSLRSPTQRPRAPGGDLDSTTVLAFPCRDLLAGELGLFGSSADHGLINSQKALLTATADGAEISAAKQW